MAHPYTARTRNSNALDHISPVLSGDNLLLYTTALCSQVLGDLVQISRPHPIHHYSGCVPRSRPRNSHKVLGPPAPPSLFFSATYHFRYPVSVTLLIFHVTTLHISKTISPCEANNIPTYPDLLNPIRPIPFHNYPMSPSLSTKEDFSRTNASHKRAIHLDVNMASNEMMAQSSSSSLPKDIRNYIM
ncbi:hypothetical protein DFH29DRAFT_326334 [Suillus ampliporus]|nr:hypothetical protein DFH29DRAFT_326334 [Suillus ampliporus]